ncbi:MAG: hypothetical protein AAF492_32740, partial [Verrucomicrobiota bacterium]
LDDYEGWSFEHQVDEGNIYDLILRNNDCNGNGGSPDAVDDGLELDIQDTTGPWTFRIWLDGNDVANDPYRTEDNGTVGTFAIACETGCPGVQPITTAAELASVWTHNGNLQDGAAVTAGDIANYTDDQDIIATAAVMGPSATAASLPEHPVENAPDLKPEDLAGLLAEAKSRWQETGLLDPTEISLADSVTFEVVDLPADQLAKVWFTHIVLDRDAAGHGWFVDPTPHEDEAFRGMDLLTVIMHELGHVFGRGHKDAKTHAVIAERIPVDTRLPPDAHPENH